MKIKSDVIEFESPVTFAQGVTGLPVQSQATWEAGVGTDESAVSPAKVAAAIAALASGGSPGGSSGQPQFNNGGTFGGMATVTWDAINSRISFGAGASPSGKVHVQAGAASEIGLIVQGAASQTANMQELRNSAGTALAGFTSAGLLFVPANTLAAAVAVQIGAPGTGLSGYSGGLQFVIGGSPLFSISSSGVADYPSGVISGGGRFGAGRPYFKARTTNTTVSHADSSGRFSNRGATDQVIFTLTDLYDGEEAFWGFNFTFYVRAAQYLQVKAPAGQTIMLNGTESASGGYVRCATIGAGLYVEKVEPGKWQAHALGSAGTWTIDS